jgi:hypothetical protein
MKIKFLSGLILLVVIALMYSCEKNSSAPAAFPLGCDTVKLTYSGTMKVIINSNCGTMNSSCHYPGKTRGDFSTYTALKADATGGTNSMFWKYLFINKQMPLYPELPLDVCTSAQFKAWLLSGAPQ